jgi:pyruvate formate lyase activating enzyme
VSLIERDWYRILDYRVTDDGHCPDCGTAIAGRFGIYTGDFGQHRIPVRIGA